MATLLIDPHADAWVDEAPPGRTRPVVILLVAIWVTAALGSVVLVLYGFEPLFQQRTQARMLDDYRTTLANATAAAADATTAVAAAAAPGRGDPVALLEIQDIGLQQVVVEGVRPRQTRSGPGHVPGTSGPGQPGNSVFVGRRSTFGGSFSALDELERGDEIVVTTTQGQSTYHVFSNSVRPLRSSSLEAIEGQSPDDRLTLITSAGSSPLNATEARVVVARMDAAAFPPTKQATRSATETGTQREGAGWVAGLLGAVLLAATCTGAVWCYRHLRPRNAYLLTAVPLVVITVIVSEAASGLVPAWL